MTILRVVYTLMFKNDIVLLSFRNSIHYFQTGNKIECDFFSRLYIAFNLDIHKRKNILIFKLFTYCCSKNISQICLRLKPK